MIQKALANPGRPVSYSRAAPGVRASRRRTTAPIHACRIAPIAFEEDPEGPPFGRSRVPELAPGRPPRLTEDRSKEAESRWNARCTSPCSVWSCSRRRPSGQRTEHLRSVPVALRSRPLRATALGVPPGPCGPLFLTQSVDPLTIQPLNSIACQGPDGVNENSYYRVFSELPNPFLPCAIEVGVESATSGQMGRNASIELRLYDTLAIGALPAPIFSAAYDVADQPPSVQSFDVSNSPAILSGGLVVEIFVSAAEGPGGPEFIIGSNDAGEIAPGYLRAPRCNVRVPSPLSQIGFPDMHLVMNAIGDGEPIQPSCPGDTNGDSLVNVTDLINVIGTWGSDGQGDGLRRRSRRQRRRRRDRPDHADRRMGCLSGRRPARAASRTARVSISPRPCVSRAGRGPGGKQLLRDGRLPRHAPGRAAFRAVPAKCWCRRPAPSSAAATREPGTACTIDLCAPNSNDLCVDAQPLDLSGAVRSRPDASPRRAIRRRSRVRRQSDRIAGQLVHGDRNRADDHRHDVCEH